MGPRYLIDSNAIIEHLGNRLYLAATNRMNEIIGNYDFAISVINRIEVLAYNGLPADMRTIEKFISGALIINLNEAVILTAIQVRRDFRLKLPDAIIAATALVYDLTVITRNIDDFKKVPGLNFINPHDVV